MKRAWMIGLLLGLTSFAAADETSASISLAEVLQLAPAGPAAQAAQAQARKQAQIAKAHWRGAFLPQVLGGVLYDHGDNDLAAQIFPLGQISLGARDAWAGGALARLPLLDVESMVYGVAAAQQGAQAAALAAGQAGQDSQFKALGYYLQALQLRAKRRALQDYADQLASRGNELQRLYDLGFVGEADLLKVKLGVDDAREGVAELEQKEGLMAQWLGQVLGQAQARMPADLPAALPTQDSPGPGDPAQRQDMRALDRQIQAAELAQAGAEAGFLPKLSASATYLRVDQDLLTQQERFGVGAQLTWSLFDGAVRQAKAAAAGQEAASLRDKKADALLGLAVQAQDARGQLALKRADYQRRLLSVVEAERAANLEAGRLRNGKVTVNNLIDAEELLKDRREKADQARLDWWQAWFQAQLSAGLPLSLPLEGSRP